MAEHDPNPTESVPVTLTDTDRSQAGPTPARQALVRGRLVLFFLFMVTLAGGYYGGRFARGILRSTTAEDAPPSAEEKVTTASRQEPAVPGPAILHPDAPLPATADALYQETQAAIDELVQIFPDSPDALEMKARIQIWLGKSSEAEATWQQCLKLSPNYIHAYVGMAGAAAARAEHEQALELAQHAITLDARNFQARSIAADALLQLGRAAEVPGVLEEQLSKDPRSRGHYLLGQAYAQTGNNEKARDNFAAAIRIYADYTEAYNGLAVAYERLGEKDKAQQTMEKFRQLGKQREDDPTRVREDAATDLAALQREAGIFFSDAGRVLFLAKKSNEAEQFWLRAAALDSRNVLCRQSLAWHYHNHRRWGENIAWLKQLAELEPGNPRYWIEIGHIYEELRMLRAAEEAMRQACQAAPDSDVAYVALADLLLRLGKSLPETVDLARKAVERQPTAPNYALLSAAYRANLDFAGARTAIDKSLELAPGDRAYLAAREAIEADLKPAEAEPR